MFIPGGIPQQPQYAPQQLAISGQPRPMQQPAVRPATQWQAPPPPQGYAAAPQPPATVRGVAAETPRPFKLARPEELGVSTSLNLAPKTQVAAAVPVDWNQIQARLERLRVQTYQKVRLQSGAIHVTMTLPGVATPVQAQGETEAAAVLVALHNAEQVAGSR
ncbi:MAG TPA: hypothetical protein VFE62_18255 [Gemmataceae bacterium]|nr:hypothetical protein [Gemmataceae bacterium]